jgi:hypothetical protein
MLLCVDGDGYKNGWIYILDLEQTKIKTLFCAKHGDISNYRGPTSGICKIDVEVESVREDRNCIVQGGTDKKIGTVELKWGRGRSTGFMTKLHIARNI